ncbi:retrovirus-related pol polyprotein from transposon TNT 1-94, partial [Tanacetum coccineum]
AEAVATACYTQNRSLIHTRHYKTPYELVHDKKPDLTLFRVFGAICYLTNDNEDLGKLQPTADIGIFVGCAPSRKGSGPKDLVFIKSLAHNSEMSITGSNKPKLSGAKDFTLSNHDIGKVPSNESQKNTTDHSVVFSDSPVTDYDSANDSSVYSTPLPPLEKLTSAKPISGPKTIKSILKSNSTFKAETLKECENRR